MSELQFAFHAQAHGEIRGLSSCLPHYTFQLPLVYPRLRLLHVPSRRDALVARRDTFLTEYKR
jgi:hypothetical protein